MVGEGGGVFQVLGAEYIGDKEDDVREKVRIGSEHNKNRYDQFHSKAKIIR